MIGTEILDDDGGVTDGEAAYLDSRGSARSAGFPFGLAESGRGFLQAAKRIS